MDPASQFVTILGAIPVGLAIHTNFAALRPQARLQKWDERVEHISSVVSEKGEHVPVEEMEAFIHLLQQYQQAKVTYRTLVESGKCKWYKGFGKAEGDRFALRARMAYEKGLSTSTLASLRKSESYLTNSTPGPSPTVPDAPPTLLTLIGPAATISGPSSDSGLPPDYAETTTDADRDLASYEASLSYVSENDTRNTMTEDDNQSFVGQYDLEDEEISAAYEIFRRLPVDKNAWGSLASLAEITRSLKIREPPQ